MKSPPVTSTVGVREWMLAHFLLMIPVVNIIMILVWAFGKRTPPSKANWAKSLLLWLVIGLVLWLLSALAVAGGIAILSGPPDAVQ